MGGGGRRGQRPAPPALQLLAGGAGAAVGLARPPARRASLRPVFAPCRVDVAHLILYHLSICCKKKYFDFEREILPFASENWDSLLLGEVRAGPGPGGAQRGGSLGFLFASCWGWTRSRSLPGS